MSSTANADRDRAIAAIEAEQRRLQMEQQRLATEERQREAQRAEELKRLEVEREKTAAEKERAAEERKATEAARAAEIEKLMALQKEMYGGACPASTSGATGNSGSPWATGTFTPPFVPIHPPILRLT